MKQDQDSDCGERNKATLVQIRGIIGDNNGIIGDTHNTQDQQDHDRAQATQGRAELKHVPGHHGSRSIHGKSRNSGN